MLEEIEKNSTIKRFLNAYPTVHKLKCIQAVLIHGINSIEQKYPFGLTVDQLCTIGGLSKPKTTNEPSERRLHSKRRAPKQRKTPLYLAGIQTKLKQGMRKEVNKKKKEIPLSSQSEFTAFGEDSVRPNSTNTSTNKSLKLTIPSSIKEPETCSLDDAKSYFKKLSSSSSTPNLTNVTPKSMIVIADQFLNNPLTSCLLQQSKKKTRVKKHY